MNFLKKLFSNDKPDFVDEIEEILLKIGRSYAQIDPNTPIAPQDMEKIKGQLPSLQPTGQRMYNYYALLDRTYHRKRFVIHRLNNNIRLDLWYGTYLTSGSPDLLDNDGTEFYKNDVESYAILLVNLPSSHSNTDYGLYIENLGITLIEERYCRHKFKTFGEIEQFLLQISNSLFRLNS